MKCKEKVLNLIESLKNEESAIILVEGQRDCAALRKLGIEQHIEKISGKRIFDDLSFLEGKSVIILTDFDRTGRALFKRIRHELEVMGFNPNIYYWQQLHSITRGEIREIEELAQFCDC
ncbi:MAG: toprim domain-containing protein [Theionarchaea archaeon]|nr:toprim domain-containing protein [Theionarchaea archaeon]